MLEMTKQKKEKLEVKVSKQIEIQVNKANKLQGLIRCSDEYIDGKMLKNLFDKTQSKIQ